MIENNNDSLETMKNFNDTISSFTYNDDIVRSPISIIDNIDESIYVVDAQTILAGHHVLYNNHVETNEYTTKYEQDRAVTVESNLRKEIEDNAISFSKEFEMKKRAKEYKNATVSKTGAIDLKSIYKYKTTDDIFLRKTVVEETKNNHRLVVFVDFSGSMTKDDRIIFALKQALSLNEFCNKSNLKYDIYGFTTKFGYGDNNKPNEPIENQFCVSKNSSLYKLFSSDHHKTTNDAIKERIIKSLVYSIITRRTHFRLGQTPLNSSLLFALQDATRRIKTGSDEKLNYVFLTDGGATDSLYNMRKSVDIIDNSKVYKLSKYRYKATVQLAEILKNRPNVNSVTNFFFSASVKSTSRSLSLLFNADFNEYTHSGIFRKDRCVSIKPENGFDEVIVVNTTTPNVVKAENKSIASITKEFRREGSNAKLNSVIARKFIDNIC